MDETHELLSAEFKGLRGQVTEFQHGLTELQHEVKAFRKETKESFEKVEERIDYLAIKWMEHDEEIHKIKGERLSAWPGLAPWYRTIFDSCQQMHGRGTIGPRTQATMVPGPGTPAPAEAEAEAPPLAVAKSPQGDSVPGKQIILAAPGTHTVGTSPSS